METNVRTNSERETLSRLGELASSLSPRNNSLDENSYHYNEYNSENYEEDELEIDEINDEIFALPRLSKVKYMAADYGDPLISPLSSLDISDDDDERNKDMLQDFNNRDKKVQELILLNKLDFEKVRHSFNSSEEEWKRFLRVLYAKSEIVPDREWFNTICEFIDSMNPLLSKFQELVSDNLQVENTNTSEEYIIDLYGVEAYQTSEIDDDRYSPPNSSVFTGSRRESKDNGFTELRDVDIKAIRNYPEKLADFENAYPEFFMDAKKYFGQERRRLVNHLQENTGNTYNSEFTSFDSVTDYGVSFLNGDYDDDNPIEELRANVEEQSQACEDSELYDYFVQTFFTSRRMMPDDLWEAAICECLDNWPHLIVQLKEIIAYEVSNEGINE